MMFLNFLAGQQPGTQPGGISYSELKAIVDPVLLLISNILPLLITVVAALGSIWCVFLGVKYARADDPQEHEKAKNGLKNAIIGFVLIFVLLLALQIGSEVFKNWWGSYGTV